MSNTIDKEYEHAPTSKLDYGFDWNLWLAVGETIITSVWLVDSGLTQSNEDNVSGVTSVFVAGGVAGTSYKLKNTITTSNRRIDSRTIRLSCKNR